MPRYPDFEKIYRQFIKRYGREKGEQYYYAWLKKLGLDDTKPYGAQVREAFRWARFQGDKYYYCEAAFPVESMNKNIYTEEELIRAARTLIGKPVNLNHEKPLEGVEIVDAEYEDGAVECILRIENDEIRKMIDNGEIYHVSIEESFRDAEVKNGVKPEGIVFTGLALLTKDVLPGLPLTRIYKSTDRVLESFENHMLKEVKRELGEKEVEEQRKTCDLCGRPLSDFIEVGRFRLHPQCMQRFWQIASQIFHFSEKAVAPHDGPKAPEDHEWDARAAEQRIRKWASSDGSGDKDKIDWGKYRQAFAWYDPEHADDFGGYKLPHHDVVDGRLCVVWRGVAAAMATLMGARGGVDIPRSDRRAVYLHLARHYRQFNREPPEFREVLETYARMLEETVEEQKKTIQKLSEEKKTLEERLKRAKRYSRIIIRI